MGKAINSNWVTVTQLRKALSILKQEKCSSSGITAAMTKKELHNLLKEYGVPLWDAEFDVAKVVTRLGKKYQYTFNAAQALQDAQTLWELHYPSLTGSEEAAPVEGVNLKEVSTELLIKELTTRFSERDLMIANEQGYPIRVPWGFTAELALVKKVSSRSMKESQLLRKK